MRVMDVLLVDDDPEVVEALAEQVRMLGHRAAAFCEPAKALEVARRARFDVALLDLGMPELDGCALARRLIVLQPSGMYLVAVTGRDADADLLQTAAAGFVEHLVKPCRQATLQAVLERASQRGVMHRSQAIGYGLAPPAA